MARKVARKTVGVFSISFGVLFGIFPFIPGILLIVAGLELLGYREGVWNWLRPRLQLFSRRPVEVAELTPEL
ncbi:hypothetical protein KC722_03120 [Candidatus Kaiserbacteria bacterium]|nr:hypothetical protein [Candidatus Kaiserbacteria bacterium]MCB9812015.1 hypothetical protein [Candidatus Nomurabacteria bacterium]